jgi:hypothetical protein
MFEVKIVFRVVMFTKTFVYSLVRIPRKCTRYKIKTLRILKSWRFTLEIGNFGIISNLLFKIWFVTLVEWFLIFYRKYWYFSFGKPVYFNGYFDQYTVITGYRFTGIAIPRYV